MRLPTLPATVCTDTSCLAKCQGQNYKKPTLLWVFFHSPPAPAETMPRDRRVKKYYKSLDFVVLFAKICRMLSSYPISRLPKLAKNKGSGLRGTAPIRPLHVLGRPRPADSETTPGRIWATHHVPTGQEHMKPKNPKLGCPSQRNGAARAKKQRQISHADSA
jgi:hypothetical protein